MFNISPISTHPPKSSYASHPCTTAADLQSGEATYVAQSFVLTLAIVTAFMAAVRHFGWGFLGVWNGITVFFMARALQSSIRAVGHHMFGGKQRDQQGQGPLEVSSPQTETAERAVDEMAHLHSENKNDQIVADSDGESSVRGFQRDEASATAAKSDGPVSDNADSHRQLEMRERFKEGMGVVNAD